MEKKNILPKVLDKKIVKDYTYAVLFLLISSFFAFFAVRPALKIAVSLNKESVELDVINRQYEGNIFKVVEVQEIMQRIRDKKTVLNDALPVRPQSDQFINTIIEIFNTRDLRVQNFKVTPIELVGNVKEGELQSVSIEINAIGDYLNLRSVIADILNQRRVTTVREFSVLRDEESISASASLQVKMKLEGYSLE